MKKIPPGYILPSAAFTIKPSQICHYDFIDKPPEIGDVVYGSIIRICQHSDLENKWGRIHRINDGTRAIFVFGNRYATDAFEGIIPESFQSNVDLMARSGIIGMVRISNTRMKDPSRVKILGYACDKEGKRLNTREYPLIKPRIHKKKTSRSKLILVVGTAMNSGKSASAAACCWALSTMGYKVRGSKITGTAGLKDILHMEDAGAGIVNDFSYFGFPSTYLLDPKDLMQIFNDLDLKYGNNLKNYWVVEIADGILQRETSILLSDKTVTGRIHRLILSAQDTFGALGGLHQLREHYGLVPDAISGVCSSSPLSIRELSHLTDIPVFNNISWDLKMLSDILIGSKS
ncbi:hypothetical protein ACFL5V_12065 [Fibrobacterota bacterium]